MARNIAVRRTNPANRWLLSTNTDMVLRPRTDEIPSEIVRHLPDGGVPAPAVRVAGVALGNVDAANEAGATLPRSPLGPRFHLDELPSHELPYIRFDAPSDFQLMLRYDARDSTASTSACSRLARGHQHRQASDAPPRLDPDHRSARRLSLQPQPHPNRLPGNGGVENDFDRFFFDVEESALPSQQAAGLVDEAVEEISIHRRVGRTLADSLIAAIPPHDSQTVVTTADWAFGLTYDSGHVLPFVADSIAVSPAGATIAYLGANPTFERMLGVLTTELTQD